MQVFLGISIIIILISIRNSILKKISGVESKLDGFMLQMDRKATSQPGQKVKVTESNIEVKAAEKTVKQQVVKPTVPKVKFNSKPKPKPKEIIESKKEVKSEKLKRSYKGWEKFIGENLLNKIGIAILVLGIGYFVKFAIDKDWIGEIGRVGIGVLAGGIMLGFAFRLRNSFRAFSSVLTGGAIATLYFSIYLGFAEYQLFSPSITFILMLLITAFSSVLSLTYNRIELAVIALIGGLGTPLMVSTGNGNYVILFVYLIVLNGGMLAIAFKKQWKLINVLSFLGTVIMTGGWLIKANSNNEDYNSVIALGFGGILFIEFFLMNILRNIKQKIKFEAFDFSMLLANMALFYAFGMTVLTNVFDGGLKGLFTIGLAAFNFGFAFYLRKKNGVDKNIIYLLVGLVLTLASLAAPIQLEGNQITLFWAAEMCLLLWLSQKSNLKIIQLGSVVLFFATLISLFMDWNLYSSPDVGSVVLNKIFVTGFAVLIALFIYNKLLKNNPEGFWRMKVDELRKICQVTALLLTYTIGHLELYYQMGEYGLTSDVKSLWNATYLITFVTLFVGLKKDKLNEEFKLVLLPLSLAVIGAYLFYFQDGIIGLRSIKSFAVFNVHYLLTAFVGLLLFITHKLVIGSPTLNHAFGRFLRPLVAFVIVVLVSQELNHFVIEFFGGEQTDIGMLKQLRKTGYALVWGMLSFVFMFLGIKQQKRDWRIISLILFSITLIKLFVYDIRGISEGGKIAAFIGLGVILLSVSFMYQKVKDLIFSDESKNVIND